jgi:hypothetical protein
MAQGRFWNLERAARSRKPTPVNDLHEIEEIVQIQHGYIIVRLFGRCVAILATYRPMV